MRSTLFGVIALSCLWCVRAEGAVTLRASSATVAAAGETAEVCVSLETGGAEVAGTQNDLIWDGSCATLPAAGSCSVVGAHGKLLSAATQCGDFCLRAILLSLTDVDPIADGPLYCCRFTAEAAPGGCCGISVTNVGAADPDGKAISSTGIAAQLCVSSSAPIGSPTPTATPGPQPPFSDDDGCQIGPRRTGASWGAPWLVAAAMIVVRHLRARRRARVTARHG